MKKQIVYILLLFVFSIVSAQDSSYVQLVDSGAVKPSKMPVIAFAIVGAFVGIAIGATIDPAEQNAIPGEMHLDVSTGGTIGLVMGTVLGGYIGHLLAKRDVRGKKEKAKKRQKDLPVGNK
ncbi:hypothetical protein KAR48_19985 [bacterium]|nr:hypothetical protein [bacterium]